MPRWFPYIALAGGALILVTGYVLWRPSSRVEETESLFDRKDLSSERNDLQLLTATPPYEDSLADDASEPDEPSSDQEVNMMGKQSTTRLPEMLVSVIGEIDLTVPERLNNLHQLVLSSDEIDQLYSFLADDGNFTGLSEERLMWLKNDIMTYLRDHDESDERYLNALSSLFLEPDQNIVIRDYALQHLSVWAEQGDGAEKVIPLLWKGSQETDGTIAGTSLLALERLDRAGLFQDPDEDIAEMAFAVVSDPSFSTASRASALQVLSRFNAQSAQLRAVEILQASSPQDAMLQVSAIGVLKNAGTDSEYQQLLSDFMTHPDTRIRRAANLALKK
ncbi:MAG: hypothetical protein Q7Q73_00480 [Verrucomicrobiota bacterium JB024]|nr:hypothetical protein [Verrucomicrobiota bacterium JB024]